MNNDQNNQDKNETINSTSSNTPPASAEPAVSNSMETTQPAISTEPAISTQPATPAQVEQNSSQTSAPEKQTLTQETNTGTTKQPKKSKKIIIIICIVCVFFGICAILAIILLPAIFKIDYSEAYKTARNLDEKLDAVIYDGDCEKIVKYYNSTYYDIDDFNGILEKCIASTKDLDGIMKKLGETAGVKNNEEIQELYKAFEKSFNSLELEPSSLEAKLELYKIWHTFEIKVNALNSKSDNSAITAAGNILIESGNESLKKYGTKWLELEIAYIDAYRAYSSSPWDNTYWKNKELYNNAKESISEYIESNQPDIKSMAPTNFEDLKATSVKLQNLLAKIADTYAENYNKGSNDCTEVADNVWCER